MGEDSFSKKIDGIIRWIFCGIVLMLPYSNAAVETGVVLSIILWLIKRCVMFYRDRSDSWGRRLIRNFRMPGSYLNPFIAVFLLTGLLSVLGGEMWQRSLEAFFTKTLEWFIIYFFVLEVFREKKHFYRVAACMLITAGVTAVDAILQYHVVGRDLLRGRGLIEGHRATAGFFHSNGLASFLVMAIPLAFSFWMAFRQSASRKKFFFPLLLGLLIWALVLSFSRGGWLIFVLESLLFMAFYNRQWMKKMFLVFILIFIVAGALFMNSRHLGKEFRMNSSNIEATVGWRWNVWEESLEILKEHPVKGFGLNTYMAVFQKYRRHKGVQPTYAHNCFVQTAVETGLVGLAALLVLLGTIVVNNGKLLCTLSSLRDNPLELIFLGLYAAVVGFIVHAAVETNFYSLTLSALFWILAGLLTPLARLIRQGEGAKV